MPVQPGLIATVTLALGVAFVAGFIARKLRLPPLVGYLAAGIVLGPFTPGLIADRQLASELADIGVVLLMFGVGVQFSFHDLARVRHVAVPGALGQIAITVIATVLLTRLWGWSLVAGVVFGFSLSVASTVALLRGLTDRNALDTTHGHIALGWSVVQDVVTVVVLILLPAVAVLTNPGGGNVDAAEIGLALGLTLARVAALGLLMLIVGTRVVPWILVEVAKTGSRELFTLGVLAAYRWRSARSSPARPWPSPTSAIMPPPRLCRCATRSRCCSSSRSACSSTRASYLPRRSKWSRRSASSSSSMPSRRRRWS